MGTGQSSTAHAQTKRIKNGTRVSNLKLGEQTDLDELVLCELRRLEVVVEQRLRKRVMKSITLRFALRVATQTVEI